MSEITFRSDMGVKFVQAVGDDTTVTRAARVSIDGAGTDETQDSKAGLIRYLVQHRHASPFEHGSMTVLVECPIFVAREWMRHRTFSFNELSGRYSHLEPVFWVPAEGRGVLEPSDFRPARPILVPDEGNRESLIKDLTIGYGMAWVAYSQMLKEEVAREVARAVLPGGTYTAFYATANPRNWLNFLSLRTHDPAAAHVSYPLAEIEDAARQCEALFAERWPLTYLAFVNNGRISP